MNQAFALGNMNGGSNPNMLPPQQQYPVRQGHPQQQQQQQQQQQALMQPAYRYQVVPLAQAQAGRNPANGADGAQHVTSSPVPIGMVPAQPGTISKQQQQQQQQANQNIV